MPKWTKDEVRFLLLLSFKLRRASSPRIWYCIDWRAQEFVHPRGDHTSTSSEGTSIHSIVCR